jgi:hypothetical protein
MLLKRALPPLLAALALVAADADRLAAQAPPPSDTAKAMAGDWELSNADRDRTCTINFKLSSAGQNYAIEFGPKCAEAFPPLRPVVGWTLGRNDMLVLVDQSGSAVLELLEVEAGTYEGLRPNEGRYVLQNPAVAAANKERPVDDLFGEWAFVRTAGTRPICSVTLVAEAATGDSFAIQVKPGCDPLITRFNPVAWKMDRGQLLLVSGKNEIWRFEESEPATWDRIPRGRQPLALVKQGAGADAPAQ